uniref:Roadblock/LAMTOR2 domain-containing protein n=1 Tax=Hucho hucho TaxID=62062 RepID=A0A4W5K5H7_9TELE
MYYGVQGIIIVNAEDIPIKTTLDYSSTVQYAGLLHQLVMKNDLTFLRVLSKKKEIMIAPLSHSNEHVGSRDETDR